MLDIQRPKPRFAIVLWMSLAASVFLIVLPLCAMAEESGGSVSEEVMQKSMEILASVEENGITESDEAALSALGLSQEQIKMLIQLSQTESSNTAGANAENSWQVRQEDIWGIHPAVFCTLLGIIIAGAAIGAWAIFRKALLQRKEQGDNDHVLETKKNRTEKSEMKGK